MYVRAEGGGCYGGRGGGCGGGLGGGVGAPVGAAVVEKVVEAVESVAEPMGEAVGARGGLGEHLTHGVRLRLRRRRRAPSAVRSTPALLLRASGPECVAGGATVERSGTRPGDSISGVVWPSPVSRSEGARSQAAPRSRMGE
jgi:hypothetical protein